jgi:hypothetical protein
MGLITEQIPPRNFELIRDAISVILAFELPDQTVTEDVSVFRERMISLDKTNLPAVEVNFNSGDFDNQYPDTKRGEFEFFIDVHVNSAHTEGVSGDEASRLRCERIAGVVDYILSSQQYYYLGLTGRFINSKAVTSIAVGKLTDGDAMHTVTGRLTLIVRASEFVQGIEGTKLLEIASQVKIDDTDEGHLFVKESLNPISEFTAETIFTDNTAFI